MNPFVSSLLELLPDYGPWLIFGLAVLETCFVTGLVIPSGMATSLGTILAMGGSLDFAPVVAAAAAGGAVGDTVGFWVGRFAGERILSGSGRLARLAARRHPGMKQLFGRHPAYSVTVARLVSFVRTLMPMAAGMSALSYRRFLAYEILGLTGWVCLYVGIGALAGESWERAVRALDVGGALALAALCVVLWVLLRRAARLGGANRQSRRDDPSC